MLKVKFSVQRYLGSLIGFLLGIIFVLPIVILKFLIDLDWAISARLFLYPKGKRAILVYSNSPNWKTYIEKHWIPKLPANIIVLNYSERQKWKKNSPEEMIFVHWANQQSYSSKPEKKPKWSEFCPMVIAFTPWYRPTVIRFWRAFRDYKHGKKVLLKQEETKLFKMLEK